MMSTEISTKYDSEKNSPEKASNVKQIIKEFLLQHEPAFKRLTDLREKVTLCPKNTSDIQYWIPEQGWADPRGDEHFKQQRQRADTTDKRGAETFYEMMKSIGAELEDTTHALTQSCESVEDAKILDLCMAPGGYTASALRYNTGAKAYGITLPRNQGGHGVLYKSRKSTVLYLDITMLAKEFGVETIPPTHPDHGSFINDRPYLEHQFNLIFCDGQVLRKHERAEYRESVEASRLTNAQLILALQRIRPGGTLIILLHKLGSWETVELLYMFNQFSSI